MQSVRPMLRRYSLARVVSGLVATLAATASATPYPGGQWDPPAPSYGVIAQMNVPVLMDDGVSLAADVYWPADLATGQRAPGDFPVLLTQTPYSGSIGAIPTPPGDYFVERGYIFVSVDVRGTGLSGGNGGYFSPRDAQDGANLVDWAAHQLDGSNGVVGLTGCSYLGHTQAYTAAFLDPNNPVKAMIPACVGGDVYRDTYLENGIPSPAWQGAGCCAGTLLGPTIEAYMVPQYLASVSHDANGQAGDTAYYKQFWLDRDHIAQAEAMVRSGVPALIWNGWDDNGFGGLELYAALQNAYFGRPPFSPLNPGQPVTGRYQLILGNWAHGGGLDEGIMLQWFEIWLKNVWTGLPVTTYTPIHVEELASGRWVNTASYPMTSGYTQYFLDATGTLAPVQPLVAGTDSVIYAQPSVPGSNVIYTSAPFADGATLAGPMAVTVYASSSNTNLELMADLYDVAPDGTTARITRSGILGSMRAPDPNASWTDDLGLPVRPYLSLQQDVYIPAGVMTRYDIPLPPTLWALAPGHSLRLRLATQADEQDCEDARFRIVAPVIGCQPRPGILATLAGGMYMIARGGSLPSSISLPLMAHEAFSETQAGVTPTSGGVSLPLDWGEGDADGDGLTDTQDNCPYRTNPGQEDTGGIGESAPDGIGNACQCGDVTGTGMVNGEDGVFITRHGLGYDDPLFVEGGNCDVTGNGRCNGQDGVFVTRAGLGYQDPLHVAPAAQNCQNADPFAPPCTNC